MHVHNIMRPQDAWLDRIDNRRSTPFVPRITSKPNAKVPLDPIYTQHITSHDPRLSLRLAFSRPVPQEGTRYTTHLHYMPSRGVAIHIHTSTSSYISSILRDNSKGSPNNYPNLTIRPRAHGYVHTLNISCSRAYQVDTPEALEDLIQVLSAEKEIAVDLEHHSFRSFQGLTCLMQLSTRTQDYIIDTLALMTSLEALNVIFTDPKILKVFHGSDQDIKWLQRDFGIYVVNLFDTGQASRLLSKPSAKLQFLLDHYCSVKGIRCCQYWPISNLS